jgi:hypothetical protein
METTSDSQQDLLNQILSLYQTLHTLRDAGELEAFTNCKEIFLLFVEWASLDYEERPVRCRCLPEPTFDDNWHAPRCMENGPLCRLNLDESPIDENHALVGHADE